MSEWMKAIDSNDLPTSADVVVVGGGVNGAATAFNLAKRGAGKVVLIERRHIGAGATGKSGALVRAHYSNIPEAQLTHESLKIFWNWDEHIGFGDPGFEKVGFFRTVNPADVDKLKLNVADQRALGVDTRLVDAHEAKSIEPLMFTDDIELAAYEPDSGYADPNATTYAFLEGAAHFGAHIATHTEAIALQTDKQGNISGVETNRGTIATRNVIVAGGAWSDRLLKTIGIDLPLRPRLAQVVVFRWPIEKEQVRKHAVVIDGTTHSWLRPEGKNCTLIGVEHATGDIDPDNFKETVDQEYIQICRDALAKRFPVFAHSTMRGNWRGVIMESSDYHPIIDKIDAHGGLFVMTGDNGSSFKTAPATGIILSEWLLDGEPKLMDMSDFSALRYAEGRPWHDEQAYDHDRETTISR
jgi:sarcosine oxidase subunit beta